MAQDTNKPQTTGGPTGTPAGWPANCAPDDHGVGLGPRPGDIEAGIEVTADFARFSQKNDIYCRSRWDPDVRSEASKRFFASHHTVTPRKGDGYRQRDFALRNAAWTVANEYNNRGFAEGRAEGFLDEIAPYMPPVDTKAEIASPEAQSAEIKHVAKMFGADLCGITGFDERWHYSEKYDFRTKGGRPNDVVEGLPNVIVLAHSMDRDLLQTMPSALAGAAAGKIYSNEIAMSQLLAQYIRYLGYNAYASANDTALAIPYAVKAGLGEYGRNQVVITPEFGPRIRLSKIFTDLPLAHDAPKSFGVREFCDICERCADACPPKALPFGPPSDAVVNRSSIQGVKKWTADCEKCFGYWVKLQSDCAICMRVCPYNKDFSRSAWRLWRRLAGTRLRKVALWIDDRLRAGRREAPKDWWAKAQSR